MYPLKMQNTKLVIFENISWIAGSATGAIITWKQLGQSLLSIVTAILITVLTFFVKQWLHKKFKK